MHMNPYAWIGPAALFTLAAEGQSYTSYRTGAPSGVDMDAQGGVCLMGGASEHDGAMQWFLDRAQGGDVVVLRASGSDGYNDYMYTDLGGINSVETIVFNDPGAAFEPYVHQVIQNAEAIWLAGGDQWDYVSYWQDTPIDSLVRQAVNERSVAIGGTSAGMAVLGGVRFTAQYGTITTAQALSDPFATTLTLSDAPFFQVPGLGSVITDTHYDSPDRRGRHLTFLARYLHDSGVEDIKGIACNEYTAVCITPDGTARVFGEYPAYDEFAYFLRSSCALPNGPEICEAGTPLTWDRMGEAVVVYKVPGVDEGAFGINITGWDAATGGTWERWTAEAGTFNSAPGSAWSCETALVEHGSDALSVMCDVGRHALLLSGVALGSRIHVYDALGRSLSPGAIVVSDTTRIQLGPGASGPMLVRAVARSGSASAVRRVLVP